MKIGPLLFEQSETDKQTDKSTKVSVQDTILNIFILKIQDSILSCIFKILFKSIFILYLQDLKKSILTKWKILFEDTFHKIFYIV